MSDLIVLAAETESTLPIPAEVYGLLAGVIFVVLLLIVMSFSNAAQRRELKHSHGQATEADQATEAAGSEH